MSAINLSQVEENYLKAIYHLSQKGKREAPTNDVARAVQTRAASATDMIKRLFAKRLVDYKPYRGVKVTDAGKREALNVLRKHRLWETFLVNKLGFSWDRVHEVAEQLEHIRSTHLINRLDAFLDYPTTDPHGAPIPDRHGAMRMLPHTELGARSSGYSGAIVAVKDADSALLKYLEKVGAKPGKKIRILHKEPFDHSMEVDLQGNRVFISQKVSHHILVTQ